MIALSLGAGPASAAGPAAPESLDEMPSATRESVSRLLAKVRRKYGEAAVVIQTHLLLNAMRAGSHLATAVRVEGVRRQGEARYLRFHLETGMIFDDLTRNPAARVHVLWASIMEPTLERIRALALPAEGIQVVMQYHHRPYRSAHELRATLEEPGAAEEASFAVLNADVARAEATVRDLFARCRIAVDGTERPFAPPAAEGPTMPGPL